jgi:hypothetical protein
MIVVKVAGGLGNQLFQYAAARALSLKFNTELKLDLRFFDQPKYRKSFQLAPFNLPYIIATEFECKKLSNRPGNKFIKLLKKNGIQFPPYYRPSHLVEDDIMKLLTLNTLKLDSDYYLEGWLGNEMYFKDYRNILLNDLNIDHNLKSHNKKYLSLIEQSNSVSVHIRRGDYLSSAYFNKLSSKYYHDAIQYLQLKIEHPVFFFFSDDIQWVKDNYSYLDHTVFIEGNSKMLGAFSTNGAIDDLMLMRSCKHNIMANSTFSWWGAWMNTNTEKIVVTPQKWYENKKAQLWYETSNFIPGQWVRL